MQEKFSREELLNKIQDFYEVYLNRPIKDNGGGMKSGHMFPSWFVMNKLKPKFIIESGVWRGLGTWFFENASPNSNIISIDPNPHFKFYTSNKAKYQTLDFLETDWNFLDKENTVLFLDDHQNSIERIKFAQSIGIKKIMIEDNYPFCQGDCYSPKKVFSQRKYVIDAAGNKTWFQHSKEDFDFLSNNLSFYQEFPPLFIDSYTRWGDEWDQEIYQTSEQLLTEEDKEKYPIFFDERKDYTWICYMELK